MRRVHFVPLVVLAWSASLRGDVTLITHGLNGNVEDWVIPMAEQIENHPDFPGTTSSCYEIRVTAPGGTLTVTQRWLGGVVADQSDSGQILIKLDWSALANNNYSTYQVAAAVAPRLVDPLFMPDLNGRALASWPLHLIGHSRGGSLVCEVSRLLGEQGVWVDHVTTLDPHPLNNDGFVDAPLYTVVDATAKTYENVLFADNYYQLISSWVYGEPVPGAYVRRLFNLSGGYTDFLDISGSHSDTHLWYHGTIQLTTPATDTGADIHSSERQNWWTAAEQRGTNAGFRLSRMIGGDRLSAASPAGQGEVRAGMNQWWDFGAGLGNNRTPLTANAGLWPNLIQLDVTGPAQMDIGALIELHGFFQYGQDAAHPFTIAFHLDPDLNPLNGNEVTLGERAGVGTGIDRVMESDWSLATAGMGLSAGTFYVLGVMGNGTVDRFMYAQDRVTLMAVAEPPLLALLGWTESGLGVRVEGAPGQTIRLDTASDLNQWAPLATNTLSGADWEYWDIEALTEPRRFYRAVRLE